MIKRIAGCKGIYERVKENRVTIGLKTFVEVPTSQAKIEQLPICFMNYGIDSIIKRSSRSSYSSRKGERSMRSLEVIFQIVASKSDNVVSIFQKMRSAILSDIHPIKDENDVIDFSVYMYEERSEGPVGYGIPDVEVFVFVITLIYPDDI